MANLQTPTSQTDPADETEDVFTLSGPSVIPTPTESAASPTQDASVPTEEKVRRCIRRLNMKLNYGHSLCDFQARTLPPPEEIADARSDIRRVVAELESLSMSASAGWEALVESATQDANVTLRELAYISGEVRRSGQAQLSRMSTPKFDGKIESYLAFRTKFHDVVVANTSSRMAYLKLRDEALVAGNPEHLMVSGTDNLADAFKALDTLFAEEENMRNALLGRLNRVAPIPSLSDSSALRSLVALITSTRFQLQQLAVADCFESSTFSCVMTKLPAKLREEIDLQIFREKGTGGRSVEMSRRFDILIEQCNIRASLAETHKLRTEACPVKGYTQNQGIGRGFIPPRRSPKFQRRPPGGPPPLNPNPSLNLKSTNTDVRGTRREPPAYGSQVPPKPSSCMFHPAAMRHRTATCNKLKSMSVSDIKEAIANASRCFRCYEPLTTRSSLEHDCDVRCVESDCLNPLTHCRELHGAFAHSATIHSQDASESLPSQDHKDHFRENSQTTTGYSNNEGQSDFEQDEDGYDSDSSNTWKLSTGPAVVMMGSAPSDEESSMTLGRHTLRPCHAGIYVRKADGTFLEVNVFYDLGSDLSEVTYEVVSQTNSVPVNTVRDLTMYVAGANELTSFGRSELHHLPLYDESGRLLARVQVAAVDYIGKVRQVDIRSALTELKEQGINVSGVRRPCAGPIDLLLGCNLAELHPKPVEQKGHVVLAASPFGGDVLYGSHPTFPSHGNGAVQCAYTAVPLATSCAATASGLRPDELDLFDKMAALDVPLACAKCGDLKSPHDKENARREEIYRECLQFHPEDKRVVATMPWTRDLASIPDNRQSALKQLSRLTKSVSKDPRLLSSYVPAFDSMIEQGILVEVTEEDDRAWKKSGGAVWYVGHFPVVNEGSESTPIRPVFDPTIPFSGVTLTKLWERPPNMVPSMISMYWRFRERPVAICLDFKKVYWQVHLPLVESHMHRVLYNGLDPARPVKTYRMTRNSWGMVPAGAICSLAMLTVAEHFRDQYPNVYDFMKTQMYVDDGTSSCETMIEALTLAKDTHWVMSQGGFALKHFIVGGQPIEESPVDSHGLPDVLRFGRDKERVLGTIWFPREDTISFQCKINFSKKRHGRKTESDVLEGEYDSRFPELLTLRMYLSVISSLFDPLGLASPVTILLKYEFGRLMALGLKWDDAVPHGSVDDPTYERCKLLIRSLYGVAKVRFPRCVRPINIGNQNPVLVGFADSSQMAYAACVYLNWRAPSGERVSEIVMAKPRVFPKRRPVMTIPRGELCGCELLAHLVTTIQANSSYQIERIFLLSDSTIALGQIRSSPSKLKLWPAVRVENIQERTDAKDWFHIESAKNAADSATRGLSPEHLSGVWQKAPHFMTQPVENWPVVAISDAAPQLGESMEVDSLLEGRHRDPRMLLSRVPTVHLQSATSEVLEYRKEVVVNYVAELNLTGPHLGDSWFRLKRRVARVIHFVTSLPEILKRSADVPVNFSNLKRQEQRDWIEANDAYVPSPTEMLLAEYVWIKRAQSLLSAKNLASMARLNPQTDQFGLWRAVARVHNIHNAPFIIPAGHPLATVIMNWFHRKSHSSADASLACVRERYWLVRGQVLANKVVSSCVMCKKMRKKAAEVQMAPLEPFHFNRYPVFSVVLLDLCGPYLSRADHRGTRQRPIPTGQIWILVVICASSHAVHLEVVEGYGTNGFLDAYSNFVSIRGMPKKVFADQGSQIKAAGGTLQSLWDDIDLAAVQNRYCEHTEWSFVPAGAHWFVGMAERLVSSVKSGIEVSTLATHPELTKLQFSRLLYSIANIVNCRPLTVGRTRVSTLDEMRLIRPNDLLMGRSSPEASSCVPSENLAGISGKRQQFLDLLELQAGFLNQFWTKFQQTVFQTLMPRSKWTRPGREVAKGDIVIIRDTNPVRGVWTWGQVERVIKSDKDQAIRQAVVRYKKGLGLSAKQKMNKVDGPSKTVTKSVRDLCVLLETEDVA